MNKPLDRLRYHTTGAIERGEKVAIVEQLLAVAPNMQRPIVGQFIVDRRYGRCVVVAVYAAGTMDIRADNGKHYRMTGLSFR